MSNTELARHYWMAAWRNGRQALSANEIEPDKRKQTKAVRSLLIEKALEALPGDSYQVSKAWAERWVTAEKPDLAMLGGVANQSPGMLHELHGTSTSKLTVENLRWMAEHQADYTTFDRWGRPKGVETYEGELVKDADYLKAVKAREREIRINEATRNNLAWGLKQAGFIDEVDADVFNTRDNSVFLGAASPGFTSAPDDWGNQCTIIVRDLRERIARDTRKVNAVLAAQAKVEAAGGWEKFVQEYRKRIVQAVDKELSEPPSDKPE